MIKNIEDLKKVQIVCRNQKDIEDCYIDSQEIEELLKFYEERDG